MKIWRMKAADDDSLAWCSRIGGVGQPGEYRQRAGVLEVEWESGSYRVGDISWPGSLASDMLVTQRVANMLAVGDVEGFEIRPAIVHGQPGRKRRAARVRRPAGSFTLVPPLWDLWITQWGSMDVERTTLELSELGSLIPAGTEVASHRWDAEVRELLEVRSPRVPGKGLYVRGVRGLFRVAEFPRWIFCTDEVRELMLRREFSGIRFLEFGDVIEGDR